MPYCPKCRVSLAPGTLNCPLCKEASVDSPDSLIPASIPFSADIRNADEKEKLSPDELRRMVFELLSVSFSILFLVTIGFDFLANHMITWSHYTSLILVLVWLCSAMPLLLWHRPWLLFSILGPSLLGGVFLWAVFSGSFGWFLPLGLPITVVLEGAVISSTVLIGVQTHKGLNAVGIVLVAVTLVCIGINLSVSFYLKGHIDLNWSLIVGISLVPVSGFFFYLHYRVMNRASLRKLFRL